MWVVLRGWGSGRSPARARAAMDRRWRVEGDGCRVDGRPSELGSIGRGGVIERGAKLPVAGVDAERPPRLGVDEGQLADVDERVLARIGDLEGDDRVTAGDLGQGRDPVARAAEVGERRRRRRVSSGSRRRARGHGRARSRRRPPRAVRWRWRAAGRASRDCRRPAATRSRGPSRTSRPRAGCRAAPRSDRRRGRRPRPRRPCAGRPSRSASTGSGRAGARRSAAGPARPRGPAGRASGRWRSSRSCERRRRARTAGCGRARGRRRGRRPRWSPVIWPPTRRSSDSSSCRTSRSAIGPGPGRAADPVAPADASEVGGLGRFGPGTVMRSAPPPSRGAAPGRGSGPAR